MSTRKAVNTKMASVEQEKAVAAARKRQVEAKRKQKGGGKTSREMRRERSDGDHRAHVVRGKVGIPETESSRQRWELALNKKARDDLLEEMNSENEGEEEVSFCVASE